MAMFCFDSLRFDYEPYPIGFGKNIVDDKLYESLVESWPDTSLFQYMPQLGHKYSLSERNNPDRYAHFVSTNPVWQQVWREIKSESFIDQVVSNLKTQEIDLGLPVANPGQGFDKRALWKRSWQQFFGRRAKHLSVRFEFSMMPSNGGCIKPHTDSPQKLITLVYSVLKPGEWDRSWGGGTDVLRMKDPRRSFNQVNRQAEFEETEVLKTFEFEPNQVVVFVKTFNSWHSVRPMTGPNPHAMRRTLTINIESSRDI